MMWRKSLLSLWSFGGWHVFILNFMEVQTQTRISSDSSIAIVQIFENNNWDRMILYGHVEFLTFCEFTLSRSKPIRLVFRILLRNLASMTSYLFLKFVHGQCFPPLESLVNPIFEVDPLPIFNRWIWMTKKLRWEVRSTLGSREFTVIFHGKNVFLNILDVIWGLPMLSLVEMYLFIPACDIS